MERWTPPRPGVDRRLVLVMATAAGMAAANLYYAQPLLPVIARTFHAGSGTAGLIVTVSQLGYAAGIAFLLPLGDLVDRRRLRTPRVGGQLPCRPRHRRAAPSLAPSSAVSARSWVPGRSSPVC